MQTNARRCKSKNKKEKGFEDVNGNVLFSFLKWKNKAACGFLLAFEHHASYFNQMKNKEPNSHQPNNKMFIMFVKQRSF